MGLCECGCGAECRRRFLPGHQARVIVWTEERRRKQSEQSKLAGCKPPDSTGKKFPGRGAGRKWTEEARRNLSEARKRSASAKRASARLAEARQGEGNPNWRGGRSKLPYPFVWNDELKTLIRERDGGICQSCGKPPRKKYLDVHHIDGNKQNCEPSNLVTLCHSCHQRLHLGGAIAIEHTSLAVEIVAPPTRPGRAKYADLCREAYSLYSSGASVEQVAKVMGYKAATVNYWLRKAGLTRSFAEAQKLRRQRERLRVGQ